MTPFDGHTFRHSEGRVTMRHRMLFAGRCSLFFTVIGALATVSPAAASYAAGPSSTATATPSGTSVKPGHTIYQANWKSKAGSAGWKPPAGSGKWAIVKNLIRTDGLRSSLLLAPYAV